MINDSVGLAWLGNCVTGRTMVAQFMLVRYADSASIEWYLAGRVGPLCR